jgi:subtilisin family serine protease
MALGRSLVTVVVIALGAGLVTAARAPAAGTAPMLVRLHPAAGDTATGRLRAAGATQLSTELRLWRVDGSAGRRVVAALRRSGALASAHPERTYRAAVAVQEVPDPLVPQQWWRAAIGVEALTAPGPGVPVTIVDSGVDLAHPELAGRSNLTALNAQEPAAFGGVHGTAVASVLGARRNGVGVEGVYPEAVLRSWDAAVGTGTELTSSQIVAGVLAAARAGRGVVNLSLGGPVPDPSIAAAVDAAVAAGSLVVAAAGNEGLEGSPLAYPASSPHVLTVGATQRDGSPAPWSSASRFVDLAAPGAEIPAAAVDPETGTRSWSTVNGTSFAAPIVAGVAAWLWTVRPTLVADQVAEILRRSARDIGTPGRDPATGYGLLDVPAALAAATPPADSAEPDDDVAHVVRGRSGAPGVAPLTTPVRRTARRSARVDAAEDPRDAFRVWLPRGTTLTAVVRADRPVTLRLVGSGATSLAAPGRSLLARSTATGRTTRRLTYRNAVGGRWALVAVTPATTAVTSYTLSVSSR